MYMILNNQLSISMRSTLLFFSSLFLLPLFAKPLEVEVSARSAILMNADTGAILYQKHAFIPAYPASTTKIATALFTLDQKKPDLSQAVQVSAQALQMKPTKPGDYPSHWLEIDGTMMGIRRGEILSLESLLHGLLMISGNDAANAIAETLSGTIPDFMQELNLYLKGIGCLSTQYNNPHGLHHPEHVTTANDLALMMKRALKIDKFRDLIGTTVYTRPKSNKSPKSEITTFNPMIKPGRHYYPKSIGGKTGYHSNSQANLAIAAVHEGRTLIAVVLGCTKSGRYVDAKKLFEAAFQETLVEHLLIPVSQDFKQSIEGAETPLAASLQNNLSINYYPAEEPQCRAFVHWDAIELPVKKGQRVGEVRIQDESGKLLKAEALIAKEDVKGTFGFRAKRWFSRLF